MCWAGYPPHHDGTPSGHCTHTSPQVPPLVDDCSDPKTPLSQVRVRLGRLRLVLMEATQDIAAVCSSPYDIVAAAASAARCGLHTKHRESSQFTSTSRPKGSRHLPSRTAAL